MEGAGEKVPMSNADKKVEEVQEEAGATGGACGPGLFEKRHNHHVLGHHSRQRKLPPINREAIVHGALMSILDCLVKNPDTDTLVHRVPLTTLIDLWRLLNILNEDGALEEIYGGRLNADFPGGIANYVTPPTFVLSKDHPKHSEMQAMDKAVIKAGKHVPHADIEKWSAETFETMNMFLDSMWEGNAKKAEENGMHCVVECEDLDQLKRHLPFFRRHAQEQPEKTTSLIFKVPQEEKEVVELTPFQKEQKRVQFTTKCLTLLPDAEDENDAQVNTYNTWVYNTYFNIEALKNKTLYPFKEQHQLRKWLECDEEVEEDEVDTSTGDTPAVFHSEWYDTTPEGDDEEVYEDLLQDYMAPAPEAGHDEGLGSSIGSDERKTYKNDGMGVVSFHCNTM